MDALASLPPTFEHLSKRDLVVVGKSPLCGVCMVLRPCGFRH